MILRPVTDTGVQAIEHWFDDPQVSRWLGGREWLYQQLHLATAPGETFRGKTVLRTHTWLMRDGGDLPVALVTGDVYDGWGAAPETSMGLAFVVDPDRWRQGLGRHVLDALLDEPAVRDVEAFYCGVDVDNDASRRCCLAAGYILVDERPDEEATLYYRRRRRQSE